MNLQEARKRLPELEGLSDSDAIDVIQQVYYPQIERPKLEKALGYTPPPPPTPERSTLRAAGDLGLQFAGGAVSGVRMMTDLLGANNAASGGLRSAEDALQALQSAAAQADQQKIAAIMKEAEGKGFADQVVAGVRAFGTAPAAMIAQAIGTSLPTLATALIPGAGAGAVAARLGMAGAIGAGQGAGAIKGAIYDEVKTAPLPGETPEQTEARAVQAQAYAGPNADQIALGGGLGALAGSTGIERAAGALRHGVTKAAPGMLGRVGMGALTEAAPEALQGGQEKFATNTALAREGMDVDPWAGVVAGGTMEALAGGVTGGLFGIPNPGVKERRDPVKEAGDAVRSAKVPESGPMTRAVNAGTEMVAKQAEADVAAQVNAITPAPVLPTPTTLTGTDAATLMQPPENPLLGAAKEMQADRQSQARTDAALASMERRAARDQSALRDFSSGSTFDDLPATQPADVFNPSGQPFKTKMAAERAAKKTPGDVVPVPGGFVIRPKTQEGLFDATQATPDAAAGPQADAGAAPAVGGLPAGVEDDPAAGQGSAAPAVRDGQPEQPGALKLPRELAGAKPRYSYGPKAFNLEFDSDVDRAAYVIAQENTSSRDADYLKFVMDATGMDEGAARAYGRQVKDAIKARAKDAEAGALTLPDQRQQPSAAQPVSNAEQLAKRKDGEWQTFPPETGSLNLPRAEMPQVKAEHRGPMVNFLKARGVEHEADEVDPAELKPTQAEYSLEKVKRAQDFGDADRAILVSSDGYVVDGHHQWLAKGNKGEPVKVIRLKAPIKDLLPLVREFPSSTVDTETANVQNQAPAPEAGPEGAQAARTEAPAPAGGDAAPASGVSDARGTGDAQADGVTDPDDAKDMADHESARQRFNERAPRIKAARDRGDTAEVERLNEESRKDDAIMRTAMARVSKRGIDRASAEWVSKETKRFADMPIGTLMRPSEFDAAKGIFWEKTGANEWTARGEWFQKGKTRTNAEMADRGGLVEMKPAAKAESEQAKTPTTKEEGNIAKPNAAPAPVDTTNNAPSGKYQPPSKEVVWDEWKRNQNPNFQPTARQQQVIDAVAEVVDGGAFYNTDVRAGVAEVLGYEGEMGEGSAFSAEVYLARQALDAKRRNSEQKAIASELNLKPGDKLGTLIFNDFKVTNSVEVVSLSENGITANFKGKRGPVGVTFTTEVGSIKAGIERAHEKGKRKDSYEQFIAGRKSQALEPGARQYTQADAAAAERQLAQMLGDRIDAMQAKEVQKIGARFLLAMGIKTPVGKAKIKAAVTDFTRVNPLAAAGEFGVELSDSVKRPLEAQSEGRLVAEKAAAPAPAAPVPTDAKATHQDPGEKPEAATKGVVTDSLKTAAKNEDSTPGQMRKWLLADIDKEMLNAPDRADYDEAVKRMGEKDAISMYTGNGPLGKNSETGFITFDVPGDGKFKVRNSVRGLLEFRKNVSASLGFKDGGQKTVKPEQNDGVQGGSGGQMAAVVNMIEEGDFEAARDYAEAVGIKLEDVKVPRGERKPQWEQFLRDGVLPPEPASAKLEFPVQLDVDSLLSAFPAYRSYGITEASLQQDGEVKVKSKAGSDSLGTAQASGGNGSFMRSFLAGEIRKADPEKAKPAAQQKPKDTGWNMAGTGYGGKRYRGRNITTEDGREIVARVYENAGNYDEVEIKVDGVRKFTVRDSYNAQEKANAFIKTLMGGETLDLKGFERIPKGNGYFDLRDGNMTVSVEPMGQGKFQASFRGAKSSPQLVGEQGAVDWAAAYREESKRAEAKTKDKAKPFTPPEGYKPAGEPFYRDGKQIQGYAPFNIGERVTMKDSAGQSGVVESLTTPDENGVFDGALVKFDNGSEQIVKFGKLDAEAAAPAATGPRRDPAKVSMFNPYEDGDIVTIDGQDWTVKQDTPGWYLTTTGNWRGQHPTIRNIKAMADLIRAVEQAATAAPVTQEPVERAEAKVDDFGEKLPPARRAMAAKLSESLTDEDIAGQPLSKIWPLEENEAIEDTFAAAVAHVMREAIPAKPRTSYKVKSWVSKVKVLRDFAAKILRGTVSKETLLTEMDKISSLRDMGAKIRLLEQIDRSQWKRVGDVSEAPGAIRYEDGKAVPSPSASVTIDGKSHWLKGSGNLADHMDAIKAMIEGDAPESKLKFEVFRATTGDRKVFISKKGDKEHRRLMEFDTVEEARKALKDRYADIVAAWEGVKGRDNITERDLRTAENRPRTGKDHREGRDISAEEFQQTFGFRGGEFGKWVSQGKGAQERQFMLNSAYDALMDLSDIIGVPPKAISLDGTLGIAFGSRGGGWASAHFEPSNLVINLTKPRGAGALAHEWFHALDNYFSRKRGGEVLPKFPGPDAQNEYRRNNYITHKTRPMMVRKDGKGSPVTRERLAEWRKSSPDSAYLAEDQWVEDPNHKQGVRAEVEERFDELVKALDASPMLKRARAIDGVKTGDGYWSRTLERAARAFENFIQVRMNEQGYHNDFLVNVKPAVDVGKNIGRYPYLLPSEVAPIADAFTNLFNTIQTKDEDGKTVMFSRGAGQGITQKAATEVVDAIRSRWANGPEVVVVATMQDPAVPRAVREADIQQRSQGATGEPEGFWYGGKAFVVAGALNGPADVVRVLFHETLGHYGLRGVFGEGLTPILKQLAALRRKEVQAKAQQYGLDVANEQQRLQAAEEVLAEMAQTRPEIGFVQRAIAAVRAWLRKNVPLFKDMELTDAEIIQQYILPARRFVEQGTQAQAAGEAAPAFRRSQATETPEFRRWFGDSKVVDEQGRPLVVYHGTDFPRAIEAFKMRQEKAGVRAAYFTPDPAVASAYATRMGTTDYNTAPNVLPVYLALKNPLEVDGEGRGWGFVNDRALEAAKKGKHDGIIIRNVIDAASRETAYPSTVYIAFRPEQIKSATGNRGTFDPANPDIRFSRAQAGSPDDTRAKLLDTIPAGVMERLEDLTSSQRGFNRWWHRTVGTQLHKAKINKEFGRVFYAVQDFMKDTSRMATIAADQAPDLLPQVDSLKDVQKLLPQMVNTKARRADLKAASDALFDGTLRYTRNDAGEAVLVEPGSEEPGGLVWTDAELRGRGLSEKAIAMYRQARAAINQSMDNLLAADVYRMMTGMKPEMLAGDPGALASLMDKVRRAAASDEPLSAVSLALRALNAQGAQTLAQIRRLRAQVESEKGSSTPTAFLATSALKRATDLMNQIEQARESMQAKIDRIAELQARGYAPLMRFGPYTVDVVDPDGTRVFFGMYETQFAANRAARRFREQGLVVSQGVKSQREFELLKGVSPETAMLFADMLGIEKNDVMQAWLQNALAEQSALKRHIRRKGIEGFDEDSSRVVAAFLTSNSRAGARALHGLRIQEFVENVREGDVKDEAIALAQYVDNPREEAQAVRSLLFVNYIGGSIASALVNLTQTLVQTFPYLAQFGGAPGAARRLGVAMKLALGKIEDPDLAEAVQRAERDGVIKPQEVFQLQAEASRSLGSDLRVRAGLALWGSFFQAAEVFNRRVAFIAAYQTAKERKIPSPFAFAENAVDETQGVFNKGNRPNWARGAVGATLFTFKTFTIQYVEFLKRLPPKEKALALAVLVVLSGFRGIPFAEDAEDIIDTVAQHLGYSFTTKDAMHRFAANTLGKDFAEFLMSGASGTGLLPFDVSARLGMGDLLPATGLLKPSETRREDQVLEAFGVAGGFVRDALKGEVRPVAIRNLAKGIEMYDRGIYTDGRGRKVMDVTAGDAALKAIGLQPAKVASESRAVSTQYEQRALFTKVKGEISEQIALGMFEGDQDKVRRARERLADWNEKNPDAKIALSGQGIRRRVAEMRKDRTERFVSTAPRELRQQTREALGD